MLADSIRLSQNLTVSKWKEIKSILLEKQENENGGLQGTWDFAVNCYKERIEERYFSPLTNIEKGGNCSGEGFAIMAICCSLVEHFAAFKHGKIYKASSQSDQLSDHEYSSSSKMIKDFLTKEEPFCKYFNCTLADSFYKDVRCGLLHEMRTKGKWVIRSASDGIVVKDNEKKLIMINRTSFLEGLREWLNTYLETIKENSELQANFIRKMDDAAEIKEDTL